MECCFALYKLNEYLKGPAMTENEIIKYVEDSFASTTPNEQTLVICSRRCNNGPKNLEWLILPQLSNNMVSEERRKEVKELIKSDYELKFMAAHGPYFEFYVLRLDELNQFVFEYGRRMSADGSDFVNLLQPSLTLKNNHGEWESYLFNLPEFIERIYQSIGEFPPNRISMD